MSNEKVTGKEITDDQIRALRDQLIDEQMRRVAGDFEERITRANAISWCETALLGLMPDKARDRCAEIWNARNEGK
jgi:hypothetical protein